MSQPLSQAAVRFYVYIVSYYARFQGVQNSWQVGSEADSKVGDHIMGLHFAKLAKVITPCI